jgi:hypothetical protein
MTYSVIIHGDDAENGIDVQVWKGEDIVESKEFASFDAAYKFADKVAKKYGVEEVGTNY